MSLRGVYDEAISITTRDCFANARNDKPYNGSLFALAKKDGVSMSLKARDLVREALELEEDIALSTFAAEREEILEETKALEHKEVW